MHCFKTNDSGWDPCHRVVPHNAESSLSWELSFLGSLRQKTFIICTLIVLQFGHLQSSPWTLWIDAAHPSQTHICLLWTSTWVFFVLKHTTQYSVSVLSPTPHIPYGFGHSWKVSSGVRVDLEGVACLRKSVHWQANEGCWIQTASSSPRTTLGLISQHSTCLSTEHWWMMNYMPTELTTSVNGGLHPASAD